MRGRLKSVVRMPLRLRTRLRPASLTLALLDVRLVAARLSELAHGNGDIAPFSLGAALVCEPLLDDFPRRLRVPVPGRVERCGQLEPDAVHRIEEINAVDDAVVDPEYV